MVLSNAMCALNLATGVLANGICCYYEMQKEEERKREQNQLIRNAIQFEWDRHKHMEEMQEREEFDRSQASKAQCERRQKLMIQKAEMQKASARMQVDCASPEQRDCSSEANVFRSGQPSFGFRESAHEYGSFQETSTHRRSHGSSRQESSARDSRSCTFQFANQEVPAKHCHSKTRRRKTSRDILRSDSISLADSLDEEGSMESISIE